MLPLMYRLCTKVVSASERDAMYSGDRNVALQGTRGVNSALSEVQLRMLDCRQNGGSKMLVVISHRKQETNTKTKKEKHRKSTNKIMTLP